MPNPKALLLPDSLLVRYFPGGEIDLVKKVETLPDGRIQFRIRIEKRDRIDRWRDLGGGLGYVPDAD